MKLFIVAMVLMGVAITPSKATYPAERAAAMELKVSGKSVEAADEFRRLADINKAVQKDDALFNAALCLQNAGREAEAMEISLTISSPPLSALCQMELLGQAQKWNEILALSEGENFEAWPDRLIFPAYLVRAKAYMAKGQVAPAEADLISARKATVSAEQKVEVAVLLGGMHSALDRRKALKFYADAFSLAPLGGGASRRILVAQIKLLIEEGELVEARAGIETLRGFKGEDPYWTCTAFLLAAEYFDASGKPEDAARELSQAVAVEGAPEALRDQARARLVNLNAKTRG